MISSPEPRPNEKTPRPWWARVPAWAYAGTTYLTLSVLLHLRAWVNGPSDTAQFYGGDPAIFIWSLGWAAEALFHGDGPFFTNWINYPDGVNLLNNTTVLLLGVVAAPVTHVFGPVVSFNVLKTLAFAATALAAYAFAGRFVSWRPAAFVAGLIYGFSSFMISAGWLHLHLIFMPFPPLIGLGLHELLVRQRGSAARWGLLVALSAAGLFFVSSEALTVTFGFTALGLLTLVVLHRREVRARLRHAVIGIATCAVAGIAVLLYPAWYAVFGPGSGRIAAPEPLFSLYSSDLLGPVVPTSNQLLTTAGLSARGDLWSGGALPGWPAIVTNGSYLGLPLVILAIAVVVRYRRLPVVRFFTIIAAVAFILSLGPALKITGDVTSIKLPHWFLLQLPLVEAIYPYRLGAFTALAVGVLGALGLERLRSRFRGARSLFASLAAVVVVAPLVPAKPYDVVSFSTPSYFRSPAVREIPRGSVALTYPPPSPLTAQTMIWHAEADLRFRMVGAYLFAYDVDGAFTLGAKNGPTELALDDLWAGRATLDEVREMKPRILRDLASWDVSTVLVGLNEPHADDAVTLFTELFGRPPERRGGVASWHRVLSP